MADFNHDGIPDLAVLGTDRVSIYLGNGQGGFLPPVTYDAGLEPTGLTVADLNGDGKLDLLVGNAYGDVLILAGQRRRHLPALPQGRPGGGAGRGRPHRQRQARLHLRRPGARSRGRRSTAASQTTVLGDQATGLLSPGAVKLADLNGDGIPDLIVANSGGNNVLVYPGLGNGQFGPALNGGHGFFVGTNPTGITVANLNGQPDLIVANSGSNDVSILLNQATADGGFTFVPGPRLNLKTATRGIGPVATAIVPSPSGGPSSLVVSLSGSNQVSLIPGVGGGFFNDQNPTIFTVGTNPGPLRRQLRRQARPGDGQCRVERPDPDLRLHRRSIPVTTTISSGGLDPVAAFDFSSGSGFDDLVVGNDGDGILALLEGGPDGLNLTPTETEPGLPNPTELAFSALTGGQVQFYAATAGREVATLVDLSLGGETQPPPPRTTSLSSSRFNNPRWRWSEPCWSR